MKMTGDFHHPLTDWFSIKVKKLVFASIIALALTSFACEDSDKKGDGNPLPQTDLDNGAVCSGHDACKSGFCQKGAENSVCAAKISDGDVCVNVDDICSSADFKCKKAETETEYKCVKDTQPGGGNEWTGGTDEEKYIFFLKKSAEKTLACVDANTEHGIASDNIEMLKKNAKGLADPAFKDEPYTSCMKEFADYEVCEAGLDCTGLFKIWGEGEEDYGTCKSLNDTLSACIEEHAPMNMDVLVEEFKEKDKAVAQKELTCANDISGFDSDTLEDISKRANGQAEYDVFWEKPYRVCLNSYVRLYECQANLACDILMEHYNGEDKTNYGDCQSLADAVDQCMKNPANAASDVEQLCLVRISCAKDGNANHATADEIMQCADDDEKLTDANCRAAKNAYYDCLNASPVKDFCEIISDMDCADQLAAEAAACNTGD